jgi:hypothetical protein
MASAAPFVTGNGGLPVLFGLGPDFPEFLAEIPT